ncbi:MAG: UPF0149 family protein [Rhodoferax sp.]|nr:UPF0149 family protein [Rhodoferax sp.]
MEPLSAAEFDALDAMLDTLRQRLKLTPRWEFCEGFMAALVCCRRRIPPEEYLPVLLTMDGVRQPLEAVFANAALQQRFLQLWSQRWDAISQALDRKISALDDAGAYQPEVLDARAAALSGPLETAVVDRHLPAFGQLWALGFMAAVNAWPQEWAGPRNKAAKHWRSTTLDLLQALTLDDTDVPTLSAFEDAEGPPTVSVRRMQAFGDAIWAVYNMRDTWRQLGPRVQTVHAAAAPGRNDPCHCGSGKKFKKCCGGG